MAEAIVSSALNALGSIIRSEIDLVCSNHQELQNLSTKVTRIRAALRDAEKKQRGNPDLRDWLDELKDVAYEVDDLLDEREYEALRFKIEGSGIPAGVKNVCNFFLRCLCFDEQIDTVFFQLKLGMQMKRRVKTARERLDAIVEKQSNFPLEESSNSGGETGFMVAESEIIGRDGDKARIISWLTSESSGGVGGNLSVISIVGAAGVGKTALAQLIYKDGIVEKHFPERIWVRVSSDFDKVRISRAIIEHAEGGVASEYSEWALEQRRLSNVLKDKLFLLVLDNVWNTNQEEWDHLMLPLEVGKRGSKILCTARNEIVTKTIYSDKVHYLERLLRDDSLSLFERIAFKDANEKDRAELAEIGRKIAEKCDGSPLIIKRKGRQLQRYRDKEKWEYVLNEYPSDLPTVEEDTELRLQASYDNMSLHLKQCFAFCMVFPKDHAIEKDDLIKLWMAQGFLPPVDSARMEIAGDLYFEELMRQSLFETLATYDLVTRCKMKDVFHDYMKNLMGECQTMSTEAPNNVPEKTRHLSFNCGKGDLSEILETSRRAKKLRTLLHVGFSSVSQLPGDFFENLKHLGALDLSGLGISVLPNSFKNMKVLRYLNLSATPIRVLPPSVSEMYLLQTLKLNECRELSGLPENMRQLARLMYLEIEGTPNLKVLPLGIGRLSSLRTLSKFIVGDSIGSGIEELRSLNSLRGKLTIMHLERVPNKNKAEEAELMNKENIRRLELRFHDDESQSQGTNGGQQAMKDVLEGLRPNNMLQELLIFGYRGSTFPGWVGDAAFTVLVSVSLSSCDACSELPALEMLPSLKYLTIEGMNNITSVGPEIYGSDNRVIGGAFPQLEMLVLRHMHKLKAAFTEKMPSLLELYVADCPKLEELRIHDHPRLWKLTIEQYVGGNDILPWLCSDNVESLEARFIGNLSLKNLPNLRSLVIEDSPSVIGLETCHQLKMLRVEGDTMNQLPNQLQGLENLNTLKLSKCPGLQKMCQRIYGSSWPKVQHIPNIWFDDKVIQRDGAEATG